MTTQAKCRCKRETDDSHRCHGNGYTCPNEGRMRFYQANLTSLSGMQLKFQTHQTWACDECWAAYEAKNN